MNQINIATKKFTDAVKIDIGQLPVTDVKIDFNLTDGTNPVIAENKTFSMTIGTVNGELYKTDDDTVSYRYLKFDDSNVANSLIITMTMDGEEILNDTVSLTYQTSGGIDTSVLDKKLDAPATPGTVGQVLTKTADGQEWDNLPDENDYLCFTATQANSTVKLDRFGTPSTINLEYSTDKKTWTEYTWNGKDGATITLANIGDKVWWRGNNTAFSINLENAYRFTMSGSIEASGNVMSLLDKTCKSVTIPTEYCFLILFGTCASLKKAPELPATTLANWCYYGIFYNCSSLIEAPKLPATTLAEHCYDWMFCGCSSLIKAPELPATTMVNGCYKQMFQNCTSLTKAPDLPATKLENSCYSGMFMNCTSLREAPELPAIFVADYCYENMFNSCNKLEKIKASFSEWRTGTSGTSKLHTENWLFEASSTGVFEFTNSFTVATRDTSHVPAGWTIVYSCSPQSMNIYGYKMSGTQYWIRNHLSYTPVLTVDSALTLNASTLASTDIAYTEIVLDVASGATVTAGSNITLVDTPTAGKRNICVCRWSGGVCKVYVTIVEDLPQA